MDPAISLPIGEMTIVSQFTGRKNRVYLVEREGRRLVLKLCDNGGFENEKDTLMAARKAGVAVPEVVDFCDNALLMELIPGRTVNEYLGTPDMEEKVLGVAEWLAAFHGAFQSGDRTRVRSDSIFKNFIVADRIYGIDLEQSRAGAPVEDVGEALAYLLDTYPMFTEEKLALGRRFVERYEAASGRELKDIEKYVGKYLRRAAKNRPRQVELLMKKAEEIESSLPFTRP